MTLHGVHPPELFLVVIRDGLPLELESGGDEAALRGPQLGADGDGPGQLEPLETGRAAVIAQLLQQGLGQLAAGAHSVEVGGVLKSER